NKAVAEDSLKDEPALVEAFGYAKRHNRPVHFLGLLSNGGVHSHTDHLKALISAADQLGGEGFVHALPDGRGVDARNGKGYVAELMDYCTGKSSQLATVIGRYYAMDRDKRWERVKLAYDLLVNSQGERTRDVIGSIQKSYDSGITDEFVQPLVVTDDMDRPLAKIAEGDVVVFFNFRTDRGRELTLTLSQQDFHEQNM